MLDLCCVVCLVLFAVACCLKINNDTHTRAQNNLNTMQTLAHLFFLALTVVETYGAACSPLNYGTTWNVVSADCTFTPPTGVSYLGNPKNGQVITSSHSAAGTAVLRVKGAIAGSYAVTMDRNADAANNGRFFYLEQDAKGDLGELQLKDLTLANGYMSGSENYGRGGLIFSGAHTIQQTFAQCNNQVYCGGNLNKVFLQHVKLHNGYASWNAGAVWGPLIIVDSLVTSNKAGYATTGDQKRSGVRLESFAQKTRGSSSDNNKGKIIVINAIDGSQATSLKMFYQNDDNQLPSWFSPQFSTKYTLTTGTVGTALPSVWSGTAVTQTVNGNIVKGTFGTVKQTWRITHTGRTPSFAFAVGTKVTQGANVGYLANQLTTGNTVTWTLTKDSGMDFDTTTNIVMDNGVDALDIIQGTAISAAVIIKSDVVVYQNKPEERILVKNDGNQVTLAFVATADLNVVSNGNTITLAAAEITTITTAKAIHARDVVIEGCGNIVDTLASKTGSPGTMSTTEGYGIDRICVDTSVTAKDKIVTGILPPNVFSTAIAADAHCSGVTQPLSPGGCGMGNLPVDTQEDCDTLGSCNRFRTGCTRTYEYSITNGVKCLAPTKNYGTPTVTSVDKLAPKIIDSQPKVYKPMTIGTSSEKEAWTAGTGIKMVIHGENFPDLHPNPGECTIPSDTLSDGFVDWTGKTGSMEWKLLYGAQNVFSPYQAGEAFQVRNFKVLFVLLLCFGLLLRSAVLCFCFRHLPFTIYFSPPRTLFICSATTLCTPEKLGLTTERVT